MQSLYSEKHKVLKGITEDLNKWKDTLCYGLEGNIIKMTALPGTVSIFQTFCWGLAEDILRKILGLIVDVAQCLFTSPHHCHWDKHML